MSLYKASGVSLPIFSLPDKYGIGTIGKGAKIFIDFLAESGFSYWSILPLMPTGYLDSPYQSIASRALNPYFIDLEDLIDKGLLVQKDLNGLDWGEDERRVNYGKIYSNRILVLKKAFKRFKKGKGEYQRGYISFLRQAKFLDYACFAVLKEQNKDVSWSDYEPPFNEYSLKSFRELKKNYPEDIEFRMWTQFIFMKQWESMVEYAHSKNIAIIGEMPMYLSYDSIDVYKHHKNFLLDKNHKMEEVTGYPKDVFYEKGQVWGGPLYDFEYMKKSKYRFFLNQLKFNQELYDIVMISSFRTIFEYYSLPVNAKDGLNGTWHEGPGRDLLSVCNVNWNRIVAEDVGYHSDDLDKILEEYRIPDMKVIEFAFLPDKNNPDSMKLNNPENLYYPCYSYSTTHNCNPLVGYFNALTEEERTEALREMNRLCHHYGVDKAKTDSKDMARAALELNLASPCKVAIQSMNDILLMDEKSRINVPSFANYNWRYRITTKDLTSKLAQELYQKNRKYGRI